MRKFLPVLAVLFFCLSQKVFAITPEDYYQAGLKLYAQNQYEQSETYFKMTIQLDPLHWQAYQALGTVYYHLNRISEALTALEKSLSLHPDNASLAQFVESIRASHPEVAALPEPVPMMDNPVTAANQPPNASLLEQQNEVVSWPKVLRFNFVPDKKSNHEEWWLKFYGGYNHSDMSELISATQAWNIYYQGSGYTASSSENDNGFVAGTELGVMLDKGNALSLSLDGVFSGQYQAQANNGPGNAVLQTIDPFLAALNINYYHYFYQKQNRFYFGAGAGYGEAIVHYAGPYYPSDVETITDLFGGGFVGTLQVGEELMLSEDFTLEFSIKERYAHIPEVSAGLSGGAAALTTVPVGMSFLWNESNAGANGFKNTPLDFTGPDVKLSFDFYF